MNKPIKHWLSLLPSGYRERAIRNLDPRFMGGRAETDSMSEAINWAFSWAPSPEGADFWRCVQDHYLFREDPLHTDYTPLPTLPNE